MHANSNVLVCMHLYKCHYSMGIPQTRTLIEEDHEFQDSRGLWLEERRLYPTPSHL